jgi:methylmalonyl-CoA/ethylmalonyl-CoA epimerase
MKIHHLGIAVESFQASVPAFARVLGKSPDWEELVEDQKVRVAVFRVGESRLELLEASSEDSPIARFLSKRGQGFHHLALAVHDLEGTLQKLASEGVRLVDRKPRRGAGNELVAFIHPSSTAGVLIELVEEK